LVPYQQIPVAPNYQVPLLNKLKKKEANLTSCRSNEAHQAEEIISSGKADLVLFAESLRDPNLALTFARDLKEDIAWPKQYERAKK
jgi:2,4-dienoyl-CoA reductase-like NADH-dependent reductase (Old Yellow Enzyme family)